MIKGVIFDLDNTLYDYDKCNKIAENELVKSISSDFEVSENAATELLRVAKQNTKQKLGNEVAASHNRLLYMQDICEQIGKNPFVYAMKYYDTYWNTILNNMVLYDYVEPLIDYLNKKSIKIGILSDLTAHIQFRKITRLGLGNRIGFLVTSEEAGAEKPSDKGFMLMCKKMNLSPNEVLMIGDSDVKDIDGAKKVGMVSLKYDGDKSFLEKVKHICE